MKRHALLLIAFLALWPRLAGAQQTNTTPAISNGLSVSVDGKTLDNGPSVFIGRPRCKAGVKFKFEANYTVLVNSLEAWVTQTANQDCSDPANRQPATATPGMANCWLAGSQENVQPSTTSNLTVEAAKLFSRAGEECEEVSNQRYWVYLVPLASKSPAGAAVAPPPISGVDVRSATFTLYTKIPAAPTGVKGSSGEQTLGVDWKDAEGADPLTTYLVYYDIAQDPTGDVECGSGALVPGEPAVTSKTISTEKGSSGGTSISATQVEIGQSIAVGVVTVDAAGNESVLSEVICIERVETEGFYERYEREGGKGLEKCSVQAPGRVSWSGLSSLTLIALGLVWRRRRIA